MTTTNEAKCLPQCVEPDPKAGFYGTMHAENCPKASWKIAELKATALALADVSTSSRKEECGFRTHSSALLGGWTIRPTLTRKASNENPPPPRAPGADTEAFSDSETCRDAKPDYSDDRDNHDPARFDC